MKVLIGSAAAKIWIPEFREPKDYDYYSNEDMPRTLNGLTVEHMWDDRLEKWNWGGVATLDELYTIKHSFLHLELLWWKHALDCLIFERHGAVLIPELHDILYSIWSDKHRHAQPSAVSYGQLKTLLGI